MTDEKPTEKIRADLLDLVKGERARSRRVFIVALAAAAVVMLYAALFAVGWTRQNRDEAQSEARAQVIAGQQQAIATMQGQIKTINQERAKEGLPPIAAVAPTSPPSGSTNQAENAQTIAKLAAALVPPGEPGATGRPGKDGVSITSVSQAGCDVVIGTSDGRRYTLTNLCGDAGPSGPSGAVGPTGPSGADGANGVDGQDGVQGPAGPSGAQGPAGVDGQPGKDGADGKDGKDGAQGPTGPAGPSGAAGRGIASIDCSADSPLTVTVHFDDGTTQQAVCATPATPAAAPTTTDGQTVLPTRQTIPTRGASQ